jgi:hypothetical protein
MVMKWVKRKAEDFGMKRVRVIHLEEFFSTDTKVRSAFIRSVGDWNKFSETLSLVWYGSIAGWSNPKAMNLTVKNCMELIKSGMMVINSVEFVPDRPIVIRTAYHTLLDKRLVVDGTHTTVQLQILAETKGRIPEVLVIECYGTQVHAIFPCDFCNMIAAKLDFCNKYSGRVMQEEMK